MYNACDSNKFVNTLNLYLLIYSSFFYHFIPYSFTLLFTSCLLVNRKYTSCIFCTRVVWEKLIMKTDIEFFLFPITTITSRFSHIQYRLAKKLYFSIREFKKKKEKERNNVIRGHWNFVLCTKSDGLSALRGCHFSRRFATSTEYKW